MALSPGGMEDAVIRNLQKRTGKDLARWVTIARKSKVTDMKELRKWLKAAYDARGEATRKRRLTWPSPHPALFPRV